MAEQLFVLMCRGEMGISTIPNPALETPIAAKKDLHLFNMLFEICGVCAASLEKVVESILPKFG